MSEVEPCEMASWDGEGWDGMVCGRTAIYIYSDEREPQVPCCVLCAEGVRIAGGGSLRTLPGATADA